MFHTKKNSLRKTVKVSIFAKTSQFWFSHASISKIIKCLLVDIGEKLHSLIKKRHNSLEL